MAQDNSIIIDVEIEAEQATNDIARLTQAMEENRRNQQRLRNENRELNRAIETARRTQVQLIATYGENSVEVARNRQEIESLTTQHTENAIGLEELRESNQRLNRERRNNLRFVREEGESINSLSAYHERLNNRMRDLNLATEEGRREHQRLLPVINDVNARIQELSSNVDEQRRNVGNYSSALDGLRGAFRSAANGVEVLEASLEALKKATIIIAILEFLVDVLSRNEKVARLLATATLTLEIALKSLSSVLTNSLNVALSSGLVLWARLKVSFAEMTKDAEALEEAQRQLNEALGTQSKDVKNLGDSYDNAKSKMTGALDEATKFVNLERDIPKVNAALEKQVATLDGVRQKYRAISDDDNQNMQDRLRALQQEDLITSELNEKRLKILQNNLTLAKADLNLNKESSEKKTAMLEAETALIEAQNDAEQESADVLREIGLLKLDIKEQDLDFAIDAFDKKKTLLEAEIANEGLSIEQRKALYEDLKQTVKTSTEESLAIIQTSTDKQIDLNDLISTNDAKLLNEKIHGLKLSERMANRLLEVVKETQQAEADVKIAGVELDKSIREQELENFKIFTANELATLEDSKNRLLAKKGLFNQKDQQQLLDYQTQINALNDVQYEKELEDLLVQKDAKLINEADYLAQVEEMKTNHLLKLKEQQDQADAEAKQKRLDNITLIEEETDKHTKMVIDVVDSGLSTLQHNRQQSQEVEKESLELKHDDELASLESLKRRKVITEEEYNEQKKTLLNKQNNEEQELTKKHAKEQHDIEVKQFWFSQAKALVDIGVDTAVGVSKALASLNIPLSIAIGATGLANAALVATKKPPQPPQFEQGGIVSSYGVFGGKSHAEGGNNLYDSSGTLIAEVERDEAFAVVKKGSATMEALSYINASNGGKAFDNSFKMENGGVIEAEDAPIPEAKEIIVVTRVEDIQMGIETNQNAIKNTII